MTEPLTTTYDGYRAGSAHPDPASPRPGRRALWALSRAGDEHLQTLVDLVQDLCDVPLAALAIFDGDDYHLNVTAGIDPLVCDAADSLCVHVMDTRDTVKVVDVRADGRFDASPYVDGRLMELGFYASGPVYDPGGEMVGRLCVFDHHPRDLSDAQLRALTVVAEDVTHLIELQLRRESDRPLLHEEADDQIVRAAAQIGHDLRTPLTAVLTALEMLAETEPDHDPTRRRILNSAHRATRGMTGIVEGLLRLHASGQGTASRPVDLAEVAEQVARDCTLMVRATGGTLTVGPLPTVHGDPDQLYSVLLNLVTNAAKFTRPGVPPEIEVTAHETDLGVRVEVSDNGPGIPESEHATVFEMSRRLSSVTRGHGIGLATVAQVVRAHGGRLGVETSPAGGATVWFELPEHDD
jgi:signal transduction histidine kinase